MKILIVSEMSVPYSIGGGEGRYALLVCAHFTLRESEHASQ